MGWIVATSAFLLAYAVTGLMMLGLYRYAHRKTPEIFTKKPGGFRGTVFWPKMALTYLSVKFGGAPSDALCGGNCAVCPFQHDHQQPETFTVDDI